MIAAIALAVFFTFFSDRLRGSRKPAVPPVASAPAAPPRLAEPPLARALDFGDVRAPDDVRRVAAWAVAEADNGRSRFAIVDKRLSLIHI